jgi:drug/metabolite transporter (DMT)-like permease
MTPVTAPYRLGLAIALKLGAVFIFMVMSALIKAASEFVPPGQAVFFRSACALPVIMLWLWQRGQLHDGLRANNILGHVWRGLFGTTAMGLTFAGLALLPLPEVTAIGYATPMFTVIFAAIFLGERIRLIRVSAVALGLVGVMIVITPRLSVGSDPLNEAARFGVICVLTAAIMRALVQIHVRKLVQTDHTAAIVFYFSVTASALALTSLPIGWLWQHPAWTWVRPGGFALGLLVLSGLLGGIAQIMVTSSYRFAGVSILAPFDYSSMIFAGLIGYFVFSELPTGAMMLGAVFVTAGGVLIILRERALGLEDSKSKKSTAPQSAP